MAKSYIVLLFLLLTGFTYASRDYYDYVIVNGHSWLTYDFMNKSNPSWSVQYENISDDFRKQYQTMHPADTIYPRHGNIVVAEELGPFHSTWVLKDNKLYLSDIEYATLHADLPKIFGNEFQNGQLFAEWLTDTITLDQGKLLAEGAHSIHEYEMELHIRNGYVVDSIRYRNYIQRISKFQVDNSFIYSHINWHSLPSVKHRNVSAYLGIIPGNDGVLDSIATHSFVMIGSKIITDRNNPFFKEAIRIAKLVPEWTVLYQKNKIVAQALTIYFNDQLRKRYIQ